MHYTPLYIKTDGSLLESTIRIDTLIEYALKHHLRALAITDNTFYNVIEFYEKCLKNNIQPIIGLETQIEEETVLLYAKNYEGYKILLKLSTLQTERKLTREDFVKGNSLLYIVLYPYKESFYFYHTLGETFIGYSTLEEKEGLLEPSLYVRETLCLEREETSYLPYLEAIREGKLLINIENQYRDAYLHLEEELLSPNNYKIIDMCNVVIEKQKNLLPIYQCPNGYNAFTYLKKLCTNGMRKRFGDKTTRVYVERLKYELSVIDKMNFCNYFLVVWDYVMYAKTHNILVGTGRGSAAGSLVSYVLGITDIDPIAYDLFFERFLNPERVTMPDIDIDFEDTKREELVSYCIEKYGEKKVAPIITFGTLGAKQAVRDVARVMDANSKRVDFLCKLLDSRLSLKENYKGNSKIREFLKTEQEFQSLYKVSSFLEGLKRHSSIHAAGIVMSENSLEETIPLVKNHEKFYVTGYSMEYLESLGLLKMDFLSLTTLSTIHDILDDIKKETGKEILFEEIPENDPKTIELFENVQTVGIFQFESEGMKSFLRKYKPNTFEEIVSAIALYRPGPMENIDSYIKRKRGQEKIEYIHPDLKPILETTYGVIVYQEQIMQIASLMAGYSYGEADILRRAMSKKKESVLVKEESKFIKGSMEKGYTEEIATKVYKLILKFANYGFNRAHSVSYSMISYKLAYLKAHYEAFFMKNLLGSMIGNENKTREYIYECKMMGLSVLKPNILESIEIYKIVGGNLLFPLTGIKNVGVSAARALIEERNKKEFIDIFEFMGRCYSKSINRKVIESLIYSGALDPFHYNKKTLIENLDVLINYAEIAKDLSYEFALKPEITEYPEYSKKELMKKESEVFGFYLSDHPVTEYYLKHPEVVHLEDIPSYFDKVTSIIVLVDRIKEIQTKKGDTMCFITGSDEISSLDIVAFPSVYERYEIGEGSLLYITGKVEKRQDKYQMIVNSIKELEI